MHVFDPDTLRAELHQAAANDEFVLHYQPIYNARKLDFTCAEALSRWKHPVHGMLPPQSFIAHAEKNDSILAIGKWVAKAAIRDMAIMRRHMPGFEISFNASPAQFASEGFDTYLSGLYDEYRVPLDGLTIEITETAPLKGEGLRKTTAKVAALGVKFALDDFGTGFSTYSHLKIIEASTIKIDRTFITGVPEVDREVIIFRSIREAVRQLGAKVIAEGVETLAQSSFLLGHGVDLQQGFYFARPMQLTEMINLITGRRVRAADLMVA